MNIGGRFPSAGLVATGLLFLLNAVSPVNAHAETLRWTRTYDGKYGRDEGRGVVAANGCIYVTGSTDIEGQASNLLLRKYSPGGAAIWTRTFNGAIDQSDYGHGVAVASDGSVYVTGFTQTGSAADLLLQKYSATGAVRWTKTYGTYSGAFNLNNLGYGVVVASDGSVYVTGYTEVLEGQYTQYDLLLQKYSADGTEVWTKSYNGAVGDFDSGYGVAVAADGSVYVTGTTTVEGMYRAILLQKYSADGTVLWTKTYGGADYEDDWGHGVAVAADGSVYVVGHNYSYLDDQGSNLLLLKYSDTGTLLWGRTYNGEGNYSDEIGYGLAVADDDTVYVTGTAVVPEEAANLLLLNYSDAGMLLSMKTYNCAANYDDEGFGVAAANDGSVYVTGYTFTEEGFGDLLLQRYK